MEIGEGLFSSVISIRNKKAKGEKLEKYERTFYRENKKLVDFEKRYSEEELQEQENDDILLLEGDEVDLDELVRVEFILHMDSKTLCSENCKGLCPRCGADLNLGPCSCKKETDPRLAVLAKLLDKND